MTVFLSTLVLWIVSLTLHEFAHARVAYSGGDVTVVDKGYLTLNPLRYLHPVMSIVLPLIILVIGGIPLPGGAVYIDHTRLRSKAWESAVSVAGPLANLALFLLVGLAFKFGLVDTEDNTNTLAMTLAVFAYLQVLAFLLNMLPLPGLDGFGIIAPYLSYEIRQKSYELANVGFILLIVMLMFSPLGRTFFEIVQSLTGWLVPFDVLANGWLEFRTAIPR